jgi:hypothetical protein
MEAAGIPTVIIAVKAFQPRLEAMHVPRALITPHLMGRPLGYPYQKERQQAVLEAALALLVDAIEPGSIREL